MNILPNPILQIYRDSVLVKQQQLLHSFDLVYDGYIAQIRHQQQEIKEQIKLLFYNEIDRIDNQTHAHKHKATPKTIKMDIFDLPSDDSSDVPILGHHETESSPLPSSPPLPSLSSAVELSYLLELIIAATKPTKTSHPLHEMLPKLDDFNVEHSVTPSTLSATLSPVPPLIPPLPDLSALMNKQSELDHLDDIPLIERVMIDKSNDCSKWKCEFCRKWIVFVSDQEICKHLMSHRKERKFECKYCDKVFKTKSDVKRHSRTHTGERPHKCNVCVKGFATKYCLKIHMRTHTGEAPYECPICGKSFRQNSHLTVHWRTHTGDKPYQCTVCRKRFSQHSTMAVHYRIHSGDKPFVCPCCNRPFTQRHSLQRHVRNVHKEYANKHGVDHIRNLHHLQRLKQKQLQNNMAKADKGIKRLFKDGTVRM